MNLSMFVLLMVVTAAPARSPNFDTEIIPVLTKAGCNSGACHGAAAGRGGFHLSLLGADPSADHEQIVHSLESRRINLTHPETSLLLRKPTGQLDHGGEDALPEDSPGAQRIEAWIRAGAPRGESRRLTSLVVSPKKILCQELPAEVTIQVTARFDDGAEEDVTSWTVLTSSDPASVRMDDDHVAHINRRGQHVVIARFLDRVIPLQINVPLSDAIVDLTSEPRANFIDDQVLQLLTDLRLPVSPPASEAVWLRRVSLDLTGRLPDPDQVNRFLADTSADKRETIVDAMLSSDAFADYWTLRLSKWLRLHSLPNETEGLDAYSKWLRTEIDQGTSLDEMARRLLTATGDSHEIGPANFGRMVADPRAHAELVGQFFLGARLGCANCHNHPLDKWTQDDYHGLAAVFARLERGRQVQWTDRGAVTNLRTNEPAVPRIPAERDLSSNGDHRESVFEWVTSDEHRYFARAMVNRLWRAMFGRGLVEPTDDLRETNPATHPELLKMLADDLVAHRYSLRHTLKQIALSHTYARGDLAVPGNEADDRFYSHALRRQLEPEILADAIADTTGVPLSFADGAITRAVRLIDPVSPAPSLDTLGRCNRAAGCEESVQASGGLPGQLHLINGDLINSRLTDEEGRLRRLIAAGLSNDEIVREFYLRGLGRPPSDDESATWRRLLSSDNPDERIQRLEDFVWSLLSSRDFLENH